MSQPPRYLRPASNATCEHEWSTWVLEKKAHRGPAGPIEYEVNERVCGACGLTQQHTPLGEVSPATPPSRSGYAMAWVLLAVAFIAGMLAGHLVWR